MTGCYVYGTRIAYEHLWERSRSQGPWAHAEGPLCIRCGLPRGTYEYEEAADAHCAETGHRLGTFCCDEKCGDLAEDVAILAWRAARLAQPDAGAGT